MGACGRTAASGSYGDSRPACRAALPFDIQRSIAKAGGARPNRKGCRAAAAAAEVAAQLSVWVLSAACTCTMAITGSCTCFGRVAMGPSNSTSPEWARTGTLRRQRRHGKPTWHDERLCFMLQHCEHNGHSNSLMHAGRLSRGWCRCQGSLAAAAAGGRLHSCMPAPWLFRRVFRSRRY